MKLNIEKMSLAELTELNAKVTAELPKAKAREASAARAEIEKILATRGFKFADVMTSAPTPRKTSKSAAPKWKNPANGQTWAGRGRKPNGFSADTWQRVAA